MSCRYPVSLGDFCLAHAETAQWGISASEAFDSCKHTLNTISLFAAKVADEGFPQALRLVLTNYVRKIQHSREPSAYLRPWISLVNSMVYLIELVAHFPYSEVREGLLGLHRGLQGVLYLEDQPEVKLASCFLLDHVKARMAQLPSEYQENLEIQAIRVVLRNIIEGYPLVWLPNTDPRRTHAAVVGSPPFRSCARLLERLPRSSWVGTISLFKEFHYLSAVCQLRDAPTLLADSNRLGVVVYRLADLSSTTGVDLAGAPDFHSARYSDMEEVLGMTRCTLRRLGCEAFDVCSLLDFEEVESSDYCSGGDLSLPSADASRPLLDESENDEGSEANDVLSLPSAEAEAISMTPTDEPSAEAMSHESISPTEEDSDSDVVSLPSVEAHESMSPIEEGSEEASSNESDASSNESEEASSNESEASSNESEEASSNEESEDIVEQDCCSEESSEVVVRRLPNRTAKKSVVHATEGATAGYTIKRIAARQSGVKGVKWSSTSSSWRTLTTNRQRVSFSVKKYGEEEALRLAIEHRKRAMTVVRAAARNSGCTGVTWQSTKRVWYARWSENKIERKKVFNPKDYDSDEQAMQEAIQWRKKKEEELYQIKLSNL
ncbi:MAG: hypothetical protein KVP17_000196 [Porospora cf. gigantea B]|uniref:uncharacterized protein n=1 Tax=Porospora cf. gigantea B TaxID=2853592 RepID=UPI003571DB64|nr:MAG: hypothetical protein KVP17_000196 [Porospora cf. gigantea B]